jgi:pilus assembly protein CpaD
LLLVALGSALAACNTIPDEPSRGVASVNVPVVTAANYTFDASAPGGSLAPGEIERLNAFFQSLGLGYGDAIYLDGAPGDAARSQVAHLAGQYGLFVQAGAPITAGYVQPETVRVVVSRRRASVPTCPNWSEPSNPNFHNKSLAGFGCSVNSNIAAMIADPIDLIHGRDAGGVSDNRTSTRAVDMYRKTAPTGAGGLAATKGGN